MGNGGHVEACDISAKICFETVSTVAQVQLGQLMVSSDRISHSKETRFKSN